jgi:hypothetical protein
MSTDSNFRVLTLHIEGVNIDKLPLEDIGAYLSDFADLIGRDSEPRYQGIKRGSLTLLARVPMDREIDVKTRGFLLRTGDAPEDAVRARERISKRLGANKARRATVLDSSNSRVVEIPVERPSAELVSIPSFERSGFLQGRIIRIGGKQETVPVELQDTDGHVYQCRAKREIARRLAKEMFDRTVRVHGRGRWTRDSGGTWYVDNFQISSFDLLDDEPLIEVINEIRKIPAPWRDAEDSDREIDRLRSGKISPHDQPV